MYVAIHTITNNIIIYQVLYNPLLLPPRVYNNKLLLPLNKVLQSWLAFAVYWTCIYGT